jgi:maltose O-acetyltransferase
MFELGPAAFVEIGSFSSVVAAVIRLDGGLVIENHALISWDVVISDLVQDAATPPDQGRSAPPPQPMLIESGAWVGARAVLLRGASVGRDAIVGAGAVVREPVEAGTVVGGNPARVVARR